jgi:Protein of unknown function (DUF1822)
MVLEEVILEPTQLFIEISEADKSTAWQQTKSSATPTSRWNAYLNQVSLNAFLPWLQEERNETAKATNSKNALASLWELVNGTSVNIDGKRLLLVPSENCDFDELRVPQEWVDIPSWAADYYLGVQVNLDDNYIRVWGYCSHTQLKKTENYDGRDRSYTVEEDNLIEDLSVLWLSQEFCPNEVTKAEIAPIAAISSEQVKNLTERLGSADLLMPRLAIPFQYWAALVENDSTRQKLVNKRRGQQELPSVVDWLKASAANLVEEYGWRQVEFQPSVVGARGESATLERPAIALAKKMAIAGQPYELRILPLTSGDQKIWGFELRSLLPGGLVPTGYKLRLLTEELESFEGNEEVAKKPVEQLYLEVVLETGEGLVWEIEPTPDNFEREILWF